jgi:hypothetical protein
MDEHLSEIERAIQNDLTDEDRARLERSRDLYREKVKGRDLVEWLAIGKGHTVRVRLAQRLARTNERKGSAYNKYLAQLMARDGINAKDKKEKATMTALAFLCDDTHPERLKVLTEALATMTPGERMACNSPHTARKLVTKLLDTKDKAPSETERSTQELLIEQGSAAFDTIARLTTQLARAKDGNNLDYDKDEDKHVFDVLMSKPLKFKRLVAMFNATEKRPAKPPMPSAKRRK